MTGALESGAGEGAFRARAGALTLLYIASPMDRRLLLAMLAEATTGVRLIDAADLPDPDAPLDIDIIADPYLVEAADPDADPDAALEWETPLRPSPAGLEMLVVAPVLEQWLAACPAGPLELGPEGGPALSALLRGWSSGAVHAFAAGPVTIAVAAEEVGTLGEDAVGALVDDLEGVGLLEVLPDDVLEDNEGNEERFTATNWLRTATAPLAAAARMELRHPPGDTAPVAARDVEAAFQLALPLLRLPADLSGSCSLAVELEHGVARSPAVVTARVDGGRIASCETRLDRDADARVSASSADWLNTVIDADTELIECEGEERLARALVYGLHEALFGLPVG